MPLSDRVARPLLAAMFIGGGVDALQHPDTKVKRAETVTVPLGEAVPALRHDTRTLVEANGGVQVVFGALLAVGTAPRLAASALIASLVPTTLAGHRFWEEMDEDTRALQWTQFLKNLGLLGGLVLVATERTPRSRRTAGPRGHRTGPVAEHRAGSRRARSGS